MNRINGLVEPNNPKLVIWIFTAILLPIQGGYIVLAYTLLDPDTRKKLKPAHFKAAIKDFLSEDWERQCCHGVPCGASGEQQ